MNSEKRLIFWEKLKNCTLDDLPKLRKWLKQYEPDTYFRYRKVDEYSLYALSTDKLFFSRASSFDDPFDSYQRVNYLQLAEEFKCFSEKTIPEITSMAQNMGFPHDLLDLEGGALKLQQYFEEGRFLEFLMNYKRGVQYEALIACFSEGYGNENLWLKYGGNHYGFCLEYDFKETTSDKLILLPVYYSEEPFDATTVFKSSVVDTAVKRLNQMGMYTVAEEVKKHFPQVVETGSLCTRLIKNKCHEYDNEWRMFFSGEATTNYPFIYYKPKSITLGLRMPNSLKEIIAETATTAGIQEVYRMVINIDDELDRVPL